MKISDDQIAKVIQYLGAGGDAAPSSCPERRPPDPALIEAITEHLRSMPDVRVEYVRRLRANIDRYNIAAEEIARKIIGRAIGDQLR